MKTYFFLMIKCFAGLMMVVSLNSCTEEVTKNEEPSSEDLTIADYSKAIEINPNDAIAYRDRGAAKFDLKDYRGAIADYSKAIEINPNYAEAYGNRGIAMIKLGQKDSGCLDLSKAGELGYFDAYDVIKEYCN